MTDIAVGMQALLRERQVASRWIQAIAVAIGVVAGLVAITVFDRRQVVTFDLIGIVPDPATAGRKITVSWKVKELRDSCDGVYRRHITASDQRDWQLGDAPAAYHPTGVSVFVREFWLPSGIAPGPAKYQVEAWRWCSELQRLIWPMHDTSIAPIFFKIDPPENKDH